MAKKKELGRASNGLFFRNLGCKRTEAGYAQQKFYLGRDESKATVANLRLEELWEQVTSRWQREKSVYANRERKGSKPQLVPVSIRSPATGKAVDQGMMVLTVGLPDEDPCGERPVWDETTLAIADAIRHKTGVYGEWKLWPETVRAVEWWLRQRDKITVAPEVTTLLVTRKGQRYDSPTKRDHSNAQIPNSWDRLVEQVRKDHPKFRKLSYNKLRKTASTLIRNEADGEVAGVFLCHGTPVKSDGLLDVYTNRPFAKVFEAIDRVGERLRPLWATVKDPFPEETVKGGPNISQGTIRRIQQLRLQGFKITHIAKELNVSTETVRRWSRRSADSAADESK
ncbi:MAG: helix-turn-helix domain containing protein [Planctomycetota bacterium]|nr:helix-turn-helix domain containing protein [Planctomycetota bacterium]